MHTIAVFVCLLGVLPANDNPGDVQQVAQRYPVVRVAASRRASPLTSPLIGTDIHDENMPRPLACEGCALPPEKCRCGLARARVRHLPKKKEYRFSDLPPFSDPPPNNVYYYFRPYNFVHIPDQQAEGLSWGAGPYHPYSSNVFRRIYQRFGAAPMANPFESDDDASRQPGAEDVPSRAPEASRRFEQRTRSNELEARAQAPGHDSSDRPSVLEMLQNLKPLVGDSTSNGTTVAKEK
jgi:hypothetical protein